MKRDKSSPWEFLWYALYAFAGLGLEMVLMGGVEPALFAVRRPPAIPPPIRFSTGG